MKFIKKIKDIRCHKPVGLLTVLIVLGSSCHSKKESVLPEYKSITESVYASGIVVSRNQYQVFTTVSGIVNQIYATEGDIVSMGTPILSITNDAQKIMVDNAKLSADFNALNFNRNKLEEAKLGVALTKSKMQNEASMLERQKNLWKQNIGSKVELEQRTLAYENAKNSYESSKQRKDDLEKELNYLSKQAQNNLLLSNKNSADYLVNSKVNGKVYEMSTSKGEMISPQKPIGIIGDDKYYLLEMQVDEYDIGAIELGMSVMVVLNSNRDTVFNAIVTKINPIMNLQRKTFTVEAEFEKQPPLLYPNISFEASVIIKTKKKAMLIPRNYLLNDSIVVTKAGKKVLVKTGLKDYQMVEIVSGLGRKEAIVLPE